MIGHQASKAGDSFNGNEHSKNPIAGNRLFTIMEHTRRLQKQSADAGNHSGVEKHLVGRRQIRPFPRPIKLGPRITAWRVEDIRKLISEGNFSRNDSATDTEGYADGMGKNHV